MTTNTSYYKQFYMDACITVLFAIAFLLMSLVVFAPRTSAESCLPTDGGTGTVIEVPPGTSDPEAFCQANGGRLDTGDTSPRAGGGEVLLGNRGTCNISDSFFGFPTWFKYLDKDNSSGSCEVSTIKNGTETDIGKTAAAIGLAIFEIILRLAGVAAVGLVIFGGYKYILSQGEPDKVKGARATIINALVGGVVVIVAVMGVNVIAGGLVPAGSDEAFNLPNPLAGEGTVKKAIELALVTAGSIAVIMTVIGGIKYVTSQGNPQETTNAKNTIMYALIGLLVAVFAQVIVGYVFTNV